MTYGKEWVVVLTWNHDYVNEDYEDKCYINKSIEEVRDIVHEHFPEAWYSDEADADYWYADNGDDAEQLCWICVVKVVE